ncbi:MAG: flagellar export protein FliJ [Armatimonadota bacterium]|nr:flagellar export protein FliJ [Armatimonadota bacterium]
MKVELVELMREEAQERARLAELMHQLETSRQMLVSRLQNGGDVSELVQLDDYVKTKTDDVNVQRLTVEAVRERVEAKRAEVLEAMKRRKLLQALRDKQERMHTYECARVEQNELDNDTSVRFARSEKGIFQGQASEH